MNANLRDIRVYFIVGVVLCIVVTILIIILVSTKENSGTVRQNNTSEKNPSYITPSTGGSWNNVPFPTFTGEKDERLPEKDKAEANEGFELRKRLPITEDGFTLSYSYDVGKYVIRLSEPKQENKQKFLDWMNAKGYGDIRDGLFIFTNN